MQGTTEFLVTSAVRDLVGPSFKDLRPLKPETTETFPVYPDLEDALTGSADHPSGLLAHVLAVCSGYAYSDVGIVSMIMARMGLQNNRCREITRSVDAMLIRSTAFVVQSEDGRVAILCYRGTPPVDIISWLLDADVAPDDRPRLDTTGTDLSAGVHAGFYRNVRATRPEVVRALLGAVEKRSVLSAFVDPTYARVERSTVGSEDREPKAIKPLEALYITGHSLGGAMAALMAAMLVTEPQYAAIAGRLKGVYTFGQPMVGNRAMARQAGEALERAGVPMMRFVYREDPVPGMPPTYTGEFGHFGSEHRIAADGSVKATRSTGQPPFYRFDLASGFATFALRKVAPLRQIPWTKNLEHHLPHHYISALAPPGKPTEFGD